MSIDIRANVTCSLGTLISASINDDYIQGSGLVKTSGSCELSGIYTPSAGTIVTFSYTKNGITRNVPRKLRVLSSFADPFRRTTTVQLGCKLTYLSDLKPAPTVDRNNSTAETGKRLQCLNGYIEFPSNSDYPIPISASLLAASIFTRLGITASSNPLTNYFSKDSFDLTPGYVNVLGDLLLSESYCGYLDFNEVLQIFSLDQVGGTGPVINQSNIIDLANVGFGDRPGDAVVVRYESLTLKSNLEEEDVTSQSYALRNWEYDETVSIASSVDVKYTDANGQKRVNTYGYVPFTSSVTTYGEDRSFDDNSCIISSTVGELPDLSNSVKKRVTTSNVLKAEVANDYCAKLLEAGGSPGASDVGETTTIDEYYYDNAGQVTLQITKTWEPFFAWAGRLNLDCVFYGPNSSVSYIVLGDEPVLVRQVEIETETYYAPRPPVVKPGEQVVPEISGQKVTTSTYVNWATSQQGQQAIAGIRENSPFDNAADQLEFLSRVSESLVLDDQTINTSRNRIVYSSTRPAANQRLNNSGTTNVQAESTSELIYSIGSSLDDRIVEFSMPYQSDDFYYPSGYLVKGDAPTKAARYGRCQNRLLLGNRYGMNIQLAPEILPSAPFSPIIVLANGLSALYRVNGTNWQLNNEGIIASTDALFWGAVGASGGSTGNFWFPVAPGITSLPSTPPTVDGQMTVTRIVPTWNESILITSRLRISVTVTSLPYALQLLTNASISVHTTLDASKQFYSNIPLSVDVDVEIAGLPPIIQQSLDMRVTLADSSISAFEPIVGREVGVYVTSGYADIGVSAPIPRVQRSSDMYITGTVDSSISALSSNVPASLWHMRPVATNTTIGYLTPTFGVGSSTVLLLHMDGTNGSTVFNDSSLNTFTVTTNGDTVISTAQSQFGGSSGFFDGNLDYLSIANSDLHDLTADFTIEAWVYVSSFTSARTIAAKWGATPARAWYFEITSATVITFYCGLNGGASSLLQKSPASALVANTWYHIAVCRQSGSVRFFVNGTQIGTTATGVNATNNATAPLYIGLNADGNTAPFSGYIDELRIIKGVARYTANFTVPTSPFSS